jgi:hypothetical protein
MGQRTFPLGVSEEIPPEKSPVEEVIDAILKPMNDYLEKIEKKWKGTKDEEKTASRH